MAKTGEREAVLEILEKVRENGTYSHIAVKEVLDRCEREGMDRQQRAFVKRLAEGVIERRIELDSVIRRFTKKGTRIKPAIREILRMGVFQILYMDSVPDSAACNEAVKLAKAGGRREAAGFVNGVLRNVAREHAAEKKQRQNAPAGTGEEQDNSIGELSRRYSMPEWIIRLWNEQFPPEETQKLLAALLEVRPVTIRFDERCGEKEREEILAEMTQMGVGVQKGHYLSYCYELTGTDSITGLPGYREGRWTVQDESSMMVAEAAGLRGGETVYDVCAAPGGKAAHCASKLLALADEQKARDNSDSENGDSETETGTVHAFDLSKGKTALIVKSANRMKLPNLKAQQRDALMPVPEEEKGSADVLLCDLPCSGLGVIGRKRDIKYHVSEKQLAELEELQKKILRNAVSYLREGGTLIYSTCTIHRGENEEMAAFIERELGLKPDPLSPHLPVGVPGIKGLPGTGGKTETAGETTANCLQLLPHVHGTDGFFLARFIK